MTKINFKDLPSEETPINAENLNKLQTNVETEINKAKVFTCGSLTLTFVNTSLLQKTVTITGLSNITEAKRAVSLTCRYVEGTPTSNVKNLTYNISGNVLVISAVGDFVGGHVLVVDYVVIQKA